MKEWYDLCGKYNKAKNSIKQIFYEIDETEAQEIVIDSETPKP